jgi:hypothetical protein
MKIKTFTATHEDSLDEKVNEWLAKNDTVMVYPPSASFISIADRYQVFSVTFFYNEKKVSDMAEAFRKAAHDHK